MRVAVTAVIVIGVLMVAGSVCAADGAQRQNPYANLFTGQLNGGVPPRPLLPAPVLPFLAAPMARLEREQIRCGMSVMQGDTTIDRRMAHKTPAGPKPPSITIVQPPLCGR